MTTNVVSTDTGLDALLTLLHLQGVAADRDQLRHRSGTASFGAADIIRCARSLGLKARTHRTEWSRLPDSPLPAIALLRDGSFMVIAKASAEKVLVQSPQAQRPVLMERDELVALWGGDLILMARRAGLSQPYLFRLFGTKKELYIASSAWPRHGRVGPTASSSRPV